MFFIMACSLSAEWGFPTDWFAQIRSVERALYENRVDVLMRWASDEKIDKKTSKYYLKSLWLAFRLNKMTEKITEPEAMEWLWEYSETGNIAPVCSCRGETAVVPVCACYVFLIVYQTVSCGNIPLLSWLITKNIMAKRGVDSYIIVVAIKYKHVSVLEWMEKNAEVLRPIKEDEDNLMLKYALHGCHLPSLRWLEKYGAASAEKCREVSTHNLFRMYTNELLHEWFAEQLTLAELAQAGLTKVWWQVWQQKVLVMVLAGRRRRMRRPPPEIWQLVAEFTN